MHGAENYGQYGTAQENGGGFMMGLLVGTAIGAAVGLLLAPRTGAEMRRTLADSAERFRRRANETYNDASSAVSDLVDKGRKAARMGRERVETAVDEARTAYNEEVGSTRTGDGSTTRPY
jgi:gas vesicle protein